MENKQQIINQLLNEEEKEYRQKLSHFSKEAIERAFWKLKMNYEEVHKKPNKNVKLNLEDLDEETKSVFILMRQYQEDIKQIFLENDATITHITTVSPENMIGGKIKPSHNRANNYEIERGNWVFASSSPMDGKNPYIARQHGMILLDNNTYIYGGDIFDVQIDEECKKSASLRNHNYVYKINPSNFTPVVILKKDNLGVPFIEFSEEWVSENEVDLGDPTQIMGEPTVISSIMELLENYQILSDVKKYNKGEKLIGSILRECNSLEDAIILLREYIQSGDVRYINGEVDKNAILSEVLLLKSNEHIQENSEEVETPTLNINMNLDEFEPIKESIIDEQNQKLKSIVSQKIEAYKMLIEYRKLQNSYKLNGSFRKDLGEKKSEEKVAEQLKIIQGKINNITGKIREQFGSLAEEDIEPTLESFSAEVGNLILETKEKLMQAAEKSDLVITSCIYVSPENLRGGKLETSKDVLNISGELGNWIFAQSGTIVDNPYLLRKSGSGVCNREDMCIPGAVDLLKSINGRAVLTEPVYVYMMKTEQFEPVVSIDFMPNGEPGMRFEGEWTSDKDIEMEQVEVKKYTDVTEMLEYFQLFTANDRETYIEIANLSEAERKETLQRMMKEGRIHYINEECGINVKGLSPQSSVITGDTVRNFAKDLEVVRENESTERVIDEMSVRGENERATKSKIIDVEE